jgi:uncharacterized membrane protein
MNTETSTATPSPAQVNVGKWISEGWNLVFSELGFYLLLAIIYVVVIAIASSTAIGGFIVAGPLEAGIFYILFQKMRGVPASIGDIGKGFEFLVASILANILIGVFVAIGFVFCIIPGIILSAVYLFTFAFIIEKEMDFWAAMEASRNVIKKHLFEMSIFVVLMGIILLIGVLACGVGVFIAIPVCFAAIAFAYKDLVGINPASPTQQS